MSRTVQLHISQNEIEKYLMSQNELCGGLTVDATLEEDNVLLDVWCVDASTNKKVNIKSNRLNVGPHVARAAFLWCIFLVEITYLNNVLLYSQSWY